MTTTLERPAAQAPSPDVAPASRAARWWGQWRVALRLARRDAWRAKGRSLLVLLLIAVPVGAVAGVDIYSQASAALRTERAQALAGLGTLADARLFPADAASVRQGVFGTPMSTGDTVRTPADRAAVLAALPPGSRVVDAGSAASTILEAGSWGITASVVVQDVDDPLLAATWRVRDGRLPAARDEIALTSLAARRLHAGVGSTLAWQGIDTAAGRGSLTVVGVADPPLAGAGAYAGQDGVVAPGTLPVDPQYAGLQLLASVPGGLDWSGVRRLNAVGVVVQSRAVLGSPPPFCATDVLCLDSGPAPRAAPIEDSSTSYDPAQTAAQIAVGLVVVILQIALLAGPAFAVQLRRRQRELGLVGASGGDAATLRRTVLASGVVLGVVGAALGVALAWTSIWLTGGAFPFQPLADIGNYVGVPPLPPELLGIAAVGALAAVVAALVPAVVAGRGDVVDTLRGRRALPPIRRGVPVLGLLLGAAGVGLVAYGVSRYDGVVIGIGIVVGELGLLVVMPALVAWLSKPAGRLPLAPRLAVRDAGRHRMRTTAAAVAVAAAAAGATGAAAIAATSALLASGTGVAYPEGSRIVFVNNQLDEKGVPVPTSDADVAAALASIGRALPGSATSVLTELVPQGTLATGATISCVEPDVPVPSTPATGCTPRPTRSGSFLGSPLVLVRDPASLATLLGPLAPVDEAREALERGEVLSLGDNAVDAQGRVTLSIDTIDEQGVATSQRQVRLPAYAVATGAAPAQFLVGPAALEAGRPLAGATAQGASIAVVLPAEPDRGDAPTAIDRLALQFVKDGLGGLGYGDPGGTSSLDALILGAAAAVTAVVAVLVGLMVTSLALVDGRADSRTLASVGGPPGLRRRVAASSAGFVTLLGCTTGVASGLVASWVLSPLFGPAGDRAQHVFAVPWMVMGALVVVVPLLTAAAAYLTTRSRIPLTRRPD